MAKARRLPRLDEPVQAFMDDMNSDDLQNHDPGYLEQVMADSEDEDYPLDEDEL